MTYTVTFFQDEIRKQMGEYKTLGAARIAAARYAQDAVEQYKRWGFKVMTKIYGDFGKHFHPDARAYHVTLCDDNQKFLGSLEFFVDCDS